MSGKNARLNLVDAALFAKPPAAGQLERPAVESNKSTFAALKKNRLDDTDQKPFIFEDGSARYLYFSLHHIQSAMQIDQPDALDLVYTQKMMAFLLFVAHPGQVVLFGLGGGSLAKFCYRQLPQAKITVVEIDPDVIALRDEFLIPADNERFQVLEGDAADFITSTPRGIDVLLVDAFDRHGIAPSLENEDFIDNCRAKLASAGVLVINLADEQERCDRLIAQTRKVFEQVLILPVREDGNQLVFAFRNPQFWPRWRGLESHARGLKNRYGLDFPRFLKEMENASRQNIARHMQHLFD